MLFIFLRNLQTENKGNKERKHGGLHKLKEGFCLLELTEGRSPALALTLTRETVLGLLSSKLLEGKTPCSVLMPHEPQRPLT